MRTHVKYTGTKKTMIKPMVIDGKWRVVYHPSNKPATDIIFDSYADADAWCAKLELDCGDVIA